MLAGWIPSHFRRQGYLAVAVAFIASAALFQLKGSGAAAVPADDAGKIIYWNNRGAALLDQFKFKEAVEEFRKIVEAFPEVTPAWVNLGIAYFYDQRYPEAVAALEEALKREPEQPHAHYLLGLIYRNQDEVDRAIAAFERVHRQDPNDASTNYYLGQLYMRLRDYAKAAEYFRKVIALEPYNASAHYNLATALGRGGDREAGRKEMEEFRRLQNLFGSTTVGLQYLEQGKYAVAIQRIAERYLPAGARGETERVAVRFEDVTAESGVNFRHAGPGTATAAEGPAFVAAMGSGVAFVDYDNDRDMDLYFANAGTGAVTGALFRNRGDGHFEDVTAAAGLAVEAQTMQGCWGDFDNDGFADLYLANYGANRLFRNRGDGRFEDVTAASGVGGGDWSMGCTFVDFDHDGDLDLFVANLAQAPAGSPGAPGALDRLPPAANRLYRNNGNGTFAEVAEAAGLALVEERTVAAVAADFNDTRDVDFLLVDVSGRHRIFNNLRDGTFRAIPAPWESAAGVGVATGDLDNDGLLDLVLSDAEAGLRWWRNLGHDRFEPRKLPVPSGTSKSWGAYLFDFDNDGDLDILAVPLVLPGAGGGTPGAPVLLENRGGDFREVSEQVGLGRFAGRLVRGVSSADFDGDGDLDIVLATNGGQPWLLRNEGGNRNQWIAVRPVGTNSNKSGLGVKAEVKAGALWAKRETRGTQGFLSQGTAVVHFGLGSHEQADVIRLLWPNGVLQSEIDKPAKQVLEISELDRKGTSCPILYVWDGETFKFQTDFLGGSAYGFLVAPGVYNYPDTDEYVKLNREDVALQDGRVVVTLNNQLEEVILYDQAELVVVDHPREYEIYPDEKLLPGPPYDPFRILTAQAARPPVGAWDDHGNDLLPAIVAIDRKYPDVPGGLPFKGYAEEHALVLDLGEVDPNYVVLLMHAWIDYADSTSNLAAAQAGIRLVPPYVQVKDEAGRWVTVLERMGYPAGLPKTMTVDLSGRFLSSSREVRIVTNMKIYWDRILVATGRPRSDYRLHRLVPESAVLRYHGFPQPYSPDGRNPKGYLYDVLTSPEWKVHVGAYTRFGDVLPLLEKKDDKFVITRSGDEVRLSFDVSELPAPPAGWVRDYLVYVDGYGKDMDPNSAAPHFLGPLPFHGMSAYPYPEGEGYPQTPEYLEYLRNWNTRIYERAVPPIERPRRAEE
ncbi:MAG: hypothetical protein Kow00109_22280 [Acidobacteriota bacterium]